ncbi:ABC transporter family substrate-binding protein [Streptomyces sp. AM 4-1-1]|uniref:ABC transporter family substrate-binding protein n=1 Tax=Streptomyces sp. AM 4-1-1 TaxID=3028710 RepID=UPI0023BA2D14|nr:ABC transporter family substrate-binding protein [Streptomyces sp. AM 4-1-1]WEH35656.1 ABC transporter family substrate-binding protein [Streptomyces sp. AM 4-1-1]
MSHVGVPRGTAPRRRTLALLTTGVLALSVLAGCTVGNDTTAAMAAQDIAPTTRDAVADGSTVNWAIASMPTTLNAFQADADDATARVTGALLPSLFPLDAKGRPQLNPDYLESAKIVGREPKQVVLYKLNQQAVWSDGREIGAPDFVAQWRALNGRDSAYWSAHNAGYERIEKIERGANDLQVRVTFAKPYADWRSLFSPLYPKQVTGTPDAFNDGARATLKATAGPFQLRSVNKRDGTVSLVRSPRWWGDRAKLQGLVFRVVEPDKRVDALAEGTVDIADVDPVAADRVAQAARDGAGGQPPAHGPGADTGPAEALRSWALAHGSDEEQAEEARAARERTRLAVAAYATEQKGLRRYVVRTSLEPAYTQLALNGESGPLSDDRVRRAVARALDRQALADAVLKPLGLPARPLGSHLALAGQPAYKDSSGALGRQDTKEALALLADAGWTRGGAAKKSGDTKAGSEADEKKGARSGKDDGDDKADKDDRAAVSPDDGVYIVGGDDKPPARHGAEAPARVLAPATTAARHGDALLRQAAFLTGATGTAGTTGTRAEAAGAGDDAAAQGVPQDRHPRGAAGAYAPVGTAAPVDAAAAPGALGKDGKPLTLRFVLPSGPGSQSLRTVGDRIAAMLESIGIRTEITKVADDSYFKDHVASGDYDLALYSWPASAYPATDGRPIYAKPQPASDGSLLVEQNYTRVGTDHIDQLFDQALSELDENAARALMEEADARIWAAAGSIPLFQRPQLVAVDRKLVNAGAFGFAAPRYQDIGFRGGPRAGAPAHPYKR